MTVEKLIKSALRACGAIDPDETALGAEVSTIGLEALNSMLYRWSTMRNGIYKVDVESFPLVAGTTSYTIGTGGDFNTTRPTKIVSAYIKDGVLDYPMCEISEHDYASINEKTQTLRPSHFWYNRTYPLGTLYIYPVPDLSTYTFNTHSIKPLAQYTNVANSLNLPPEYEAALKWNLAIDIAPEFGAELSAEIVARAEESFKHLKNLNATPVPRVNTTPFLRRNMGIDQYDIYGDGR